MALSAHTSITAHVIASWQFPADSGFFKGRCLLSLHSHHLEQGLLHIYKWNCDRRTVHTPRWTSMLSREIWFSDEKTDSTMAILLAIRTKSHRRSAPRKFSGGGREATSPKTYLHCQWKTRFVVRFLVFETDILRWTDLTTCWLAPIGQMHFSPNEPG